MPHKDPEAQKRCRAEYYQKHKPELAARSACRYENKKETFLAASRKANLKKRFDMTVEEYDSLSIAQEHLCAICGGTNADGRRLAVDHDHATNKQRALLCFNCNVGLGKFNDDLELIYKVVAYLEKYKD